MCECEGGGVGGERVGVKFVSKKVSRAVSSQLLWCVWWVVFGVAYYGVSRY